MTSKKPKNRVSPPTAEENAAQPRFIILASEFPPEKYGGIAFWAKNLLDTLTANGYPAIVLAHRTRAHKRLKAKSTDQVRYIRGRDWKKLHWLYRLPQLLRELASQRNCILVAATWDELQVIYRLKALFGFRIFCSSHGTDITRHVFPNKKGSLRKINRILGTVDLFMPVSRSLDKLARSMYPALSCRSLVLGCNVDTRIFRPEPEPGKKTELRRQFGIEPDSALIITVGRMMAVKGFRHVIMALPAIIKVVPEARYMIVSHPLEPEILLIEHLVRELGLDGRVIIKAPVANEELPKLLHAADLFALTSEPVYFPYYQEEGLPRVIPEASACGLPVVVSTTGGLAEAVVDGRTGFVVHHGDHAALVERIVTLLTDKALAASMGECGRKHVEDHFSDHSMAGTILTMANNET